MASHKCATNREQNQVWNNSRIRAKNHDRLHYAYIRAQGKTDKWKKNVDDTTSGGGNFMRIKVSYHARPEFRDRHLTMRSQHLVSTLIDRAEGEGEECMLAQKLGSATVIRDRSGEKSKASTSLVDTQVTREFPNHEQ